MRQFSFLLMTLPDAPHILHGMMKNRVVVLCAALLLPAALRLASAPVQAVPETSDPFLSIDHYVPVRSTVPAISGQTSQIYVRERATTGTVLRATPLAGRVVIFVHGAGTPAEVAFDVAYQDYSWMAYLAREGFDVFSLDVTGYGRSTRPAPMNDPCNLSSEQQKLFFPGLLATPCRVSGSAHNHRFRLE